MKRSIQFEHVRPAAAGSGLLIPLLLICFAAIPKAQAQTNTAYGNGALVSLTSGVWNSGFGFEALNHDTAGKNNTAIGLRSLFSDTSGSYNTANGVYALYGNTTGFFNTAAGAFALANNTKGSQNTANGYGALYRNTGDDNTAAGFGALFSNTIGEQSVAIGTVALFRNTTGTSNTAIGHAALNENTTGNFNVALGNSAGLLASGSSNVYIGSGMLGVPGESNACYIASIFGQTSANGIPVLVNSDNKLGTTTSSKRFKEEIKAIDKASEVLLALKPVTFRYKKEIDPAGTPQFGLVAEDVEKVNPDLVVRDKEGKPYTVRYDQVNSMLLNEFLKAHRKIEEQQATIMQLNSGAAKQEGTISQLKRGMEVFAATLEEQAAQIEKVSAQIEMSKPTPKVVLNKPCR